MGKLDERMLKFNVDRVTKGNPRQAAIGEVLRDSEGSIKIMFSRSIWESNANTAEFVAIKEAFLIFGASK